MSERSVGGIKLGATRIWTLAYADDMMLVAKNREALLDMMGTLGRFLKERELVLNVEKTKVMIFNGKKKEKKGTWKWEGKEMEEEQEFRYLGFVFNRKGNYEKHKKVWTNV